VSTVHKNHEWFVDGKQIELSVYVRPVEGGFVVCVPDGERLTSTLLDPQRAVFKKKVSGADGAGLAAAGARVYSAKDHAVRAAKRVINLEWRKIIK